MSLVELIELLKSILNFFRIFSIRSDFLVKFDPKVNKKVNYEKRLKMTTKKYFFENSETSFVHQISVFLLGKQAKTDTYGLTLRITMGV